MNYKILVDNRDINDATSFYIDIIRDAIKITGNDVVVVKSLDEIDFNDIVVVVKVTSAFRVLRRNKNQKVIIWLQGIQPEEMMISKTPFFKKIFYYLSLRYLESFAFKHIHFMIYVSEEMKRHYNKKFRRGKRIEFLMPCFNLNLDTTVFDDDIRYKNLNFVYAGSLDAWQCFEKTLQIFSIIKRKNPNASLTILTREIEKAKKLAIQYGGQNIEVKYVPKDEIQYELTKYKYGFIIREDIDVNRVATPTKLNSYMASGVIPIVSESLVDFIENTEDCKYICRVPITNDILTVADTILDFNKLEFRTEDIKEEYEKVFSKYYNREYYIQKLAEVLRNTHI